MIRIQFLGTGTSEGVPIIAQPEGYDLDLGNPKNWRTRPSVHVNLNGHHIQVDAGPDFRLQCIHNSVRQIDTFILTHGHSDHIMGMDDLRRFCRLREGEALPVFSHDAGIQRIRDIFPYAIREKAEGNYPAFQLLSMPACMEVPGGKIFSTCLPHGRFEVLGLVFEDGETGRRFAYYTDCKSIPMEAAALAAGADVVVLDALRHREHASHMNIEEAVQAGQEIGGKETWFVHMCCEVDHERDSLGLPEGFQFAWDGLELVV